jgi:hypothetical protein
MKPSPLAAIAVALWAFDAFADGQPAMTVTAPLQAPARKALTVEGSLVSGEAIRRVLIRYRGPAEDYSETPMEPQYGDLYRGAIPAAQLVHPGIEYYIEGVTADGQRVALFMSARKPARVFVDTGPDAGRPRAPGGGR